jgi:hypothetical protein
MKKCLLLTNNVIFPERRLCPQAQCVGSASAQVNNFVKGSWSRQYFVDFSRKFPITFWNQLIQVLTAFGNLFMTEAAAFSKSAEIIKCCHMIHFNNIFIISEPRIKNVKTD